MPYLNDAVYKVTVRNAVSSDDASNPTYASTGVNVGMNYNVGYFDITLGGTNPSWDVTPLVDNSDDDDWAECETTTFTGAKTHRVWMSLNKVSKLNFRVDGSSGTSPTITIKLIGF